MGIRFERSQGFHYKNAWKGPQEESYRKQAIISFYHESIKHININSNKMLLKLNLFVLLGTWGSSRPLDC